MVTLDNFNSNIDWDMFGIMSEVKAFEKEREERFVTQIVDGWDVSRLQSDIQDHWEYLDFEHYPQLMSDNMYHFGYSDDGYCCPYCGR